MNPTEHTLWVSVIIVGFVVVAVAALLSLLIYLIKRIDHRVDAIGATLTAAKANTASTALIPQVATGVDAVLAEGLEHHLFWAGTLLDRIGAKLEGAAQIVRGIVADAELIGPGVEHINQTGGVVAGALPLLYGMAEGIVTGVTPREQLPETPEVARAASGTRRSQLLSAVGYREQSHS